MRASILVSLQFLVCLAAFGMFPGTAQADSLSYPAVITLSSLDTATGECVANAGQYTAPSAGQIGCKADYPWTNQTGSTTWWHRMTQDWTVNALDSDREVWVSSPQYCGANGVQTCPLGDNGSEWLSYGNPNYVYANCPTGVIGASLQDDFGNTYPNWCLLQYTGQSIPTVGSCPSGALQDTQTGQCYAPLDRSGGACPICQAVGNPIDAGSGNKYQEATDYQGGGAFPLVFKRSYNSGIANQGASLSGADQSVGAGWAGNVAAHLFIYISPRQLEVRSDPATGTQYIVPTIPVSGEYPGAVTVWHGDGGQAVFSGQFNLGDVPVEPFTAEAGSRGSLTYSNGIYTYQRTDGYTEIYDSLGRLAAVKDPHGLQQSYAYNYVTSFGIWHLQTLTVTDPTGRQMVVHYDTTTGLVSSVTVPSQVATSGTATISYGYTSGNLTSVTYLDTNVTPNYQTVVSYEYNDTATGMSHALTGLKDENGDEFATWSYDDTSGKAICSEHAPSGNVASTATTCINDTGGTDKTVITYNGDGSADVTEATGLTRHMTFTTVNGKALLASVDKRCRDCGDLSHLISYDTNGHVQSVTGFDGNVTHYSIDTAGLELSRTEAYGDATYQRTTVTTWYTPTGGTEMGLPKTITEEDATGNPLRVTTWCYNLVSGSCSDSSGIGPVWTKTEHDPVNHGGSNGLLPDRVTTYTYDSVTGRLLSADGPLASPKNDSTTFYYYPHASSPACTGTMNTGDLCAVQQVTGFITYITQYSAAGLPMSITDMNGVVTTLAYDPRGRLLSRTWDGDKTSYTYNADGSLHTVATPITQSGHTYLTYGYDRAHRVTSLLDDLGNTLTYTYTYNTGTQTYDVEEKRFAVGNGTAVFDHHRTRDDILDQLRDTDGVGNTTTSQYDANGNVTSITDPLSHVTHQYFDALNRLQQSQDPKGNYTSYQVDPLDHVTLVTSPRGLVSGFNTSYTYDAFGELLAQVSPDTGATTYDYSQWLSGAKIVKTDAKAHAVTFNYDSLYRVKSQIANGTKDITYTYDDATAGHNGIGRLASFTDSSGSSTYQYDSHGLVSKKTAVAGGNTYIAIYHRDAADNITSIAYPPANGTVVYDRDVMGRITAVGTTCCNNPTFYIATNITYMPFGPISGLHYANGLTEARNYDLAYRLTGINTPGKQVWTYGYNNDGTLSGITDSLDSTNTQSFSYDPMGRLVKATGAYGTVSIGSDSVNHPELSYDADGNRTQMTVGTTTTTYAYGNADGTGSNRLKTLTVGTQITTPVYDADGSTTTDGTYNYSYDYLDRNTLVKDVMGGATEYSADYNALGERVMKTVGTTVTSYAYDEDGHLVAEINPNGTILKQHIWLGDRPLAYYQVNINGSTSADVKYLHVDQLNTPIMMTNSTAATGWTWRPDPWGNGAISSGTYRPRFAGQYYDNQTGNTQNWMRDYDPQTGRYLQSDPIGLRGGVNTYVYVFGNPLIGRDPFGLVDINLFPVNSGQYRDAEGVTSANDEITVGAHGDTYGITDYRKYENGQVMDAWGLADLIKKNKRYKAGMKIRLYACNTGASSPDWPDFAQQLANILHTDVIAPSTFGWFENDKGDFEIYNAKDPSDPEGSGEDRSAPGQWNNFSPKPGFTPAPISGGGP
jgi:RHS repeat-associated protein